MNDLNPVLISLYVDGEASPEQVLQVEAAVAKDPQAAALLEDLRNLGEIFGLAGPQTEAEAAAEVSGELSERLHALDRTESLEGFRAVKLERGGGVAWGRIGMAAAALVLAAIGLTQMLYRPEVVVSDLTRQVVDLRGNVLKTERLERVTMRAGDVLRAGKGERISFRLHGALVVLLPRGELKLGDPRDREIFSLEEGMALCTVAEKTDPRTVHAAGCEITVDRAHFGVRVTSPGARP